MILKKIKIKNFKGIKEKELELSDKLNIFYGPNEAGKSSILEAITNGLFVSAQSTRSDLRKTWHLFSHPPLIQINFEHNGRNCSIKRDFSLREEYFEIKDSLKVKGKKEIEKAIRKIFGFGESIALEEILKFFTNTFIFRQEQLKLENDATIDKLLQIFFESHIKGAEVPPEKAAKMLEKYLNERFTKGERQAAKKPGLIRKLEGEIQELEERKSELVKKFEEAKGNAEMLTEFTKKRSRLKEQIEEIENRKRSLESLRVRLKSLDQAQEEKQYYELILRKNQIEKAIEDLNGSSNLSELKKMSVQLHAFFETTKKFETKIEQIMDEMKEIKIYEEKKNQLEKMPALDDTLLEHIRVLKEILEFEKDILKIESQLKELPDLKEDELDDIRYAALLMEKNIAKKEEATLYITLKSDFIPEIIADGKRIDFKSKELKGVFQKDLKISARDFDAFVKTKEVKAVQEASEKIIRARNLMQKYGVTDIKSLIKAFEKAGRLNSQKSAIIEQLLKKSDFLGDHLKTLLKDNRLKEFFTGVEKEIEEILEKSGASDFKDLQKIIEKRKHLQYEIAHYQDKFTDEYINQLKSFLENYKGLLDQIKTDLPEMLIKYEEGKKLLDEALIFLKSTREEKKTKKELGGQSENYENASSSLIKVLSAGKYDEESFIHPERSKTSLELIKVVFQNKEKFASLLDEFVKKAREARKLVDEYLKIKDELGEIMGTLKSIELRYPEITAFSYQSEEEISALIKESKKKIANLIVEIDALVENINDFNIDLNLSPRKKIEKLEKELKIIESELDSMKKDSYELENKISYLKGKLEDIPNYDELLNLEDEIEKKKKALENAKIHEKALRIASDAIKNASQKYHEKILEKIKDTSNSAFSAITNRKYKLELSFSENGFKGDIRILSKENDIEFLPEHLSQGTVDQVFTALRLGFIQAYLKNQSFPIFFDDSFSDYDIERLRNAADYLTNLLKNFESAQLFLFTCHKHTAHLFKDFAEEKNIEYKFHRLDL